MHTAVYPSYTNLMNMLSFCLYFLFLLTEPWNRHCLLAFLALSLSLLGNRLPAFSCRAGLGRCDEARLMYDTSCRDNWKPEDIALLQQAESELTQRLKEMELTQKELVWMREEMVAEKEMSKGGSK